MNPKCRKMKPKRHEKLRLVLAVWLDKVSSRYDQVAPQLYPFEISKWSLGNHGGDTGDPKNDGGNPFVQGRRRLSFKDSKNHFRQAWLGNKEPRSCFYFILLLDEHRSQSPPF